MNTLNIIFSMYCYIILFVGMVTIAESLDYERAKDYVLTIQAIDGGTPPLSNHATVNISVTDSNDNSPIFTQLAYPATIRENAQVGDKILQVRYFRIILLIRLAT